MSGLLPFKDELHEDAGGISILEGVREAADQPQTKAFPVADSDRTVCVVMACFDEQRMQLLERSVQSVLDQDYPHELYIVVDHNEELYLRLRSMYPEVTVMRNSRSRGAAGARNTAALAAGCSLVAFMDDDGCARPGWLRSLVEAMDRPDVVGAGGFILPRWHTDRPRWFPPEFGWIVGASIVGGAVTDEFPVRNVWSNSMVVDREAFQAVSGFREDLTKVGGVNQPEDTELCLRLSDYRGTAGQWLMVPSSLAEHYVPEHRANLRYVIDRCWSEGTGKVRMRAIVAQQYRSLSDERAYLTRTIPRAVGAGVVQSLRRRELDGLMQAGTIVIGVGAAILGALSATFKGPRVPPKQEESS